MLAARSGLVQASRDLGVTGLADHALPSAAPLDKPDPVADLPPRRRVEAEAAVEGRRFEAMGGAE
jgi:hypothetical protein